MNFATSSSNASHLIFFCDNCSFRTSLIFFAYSSSTFNKIQSVLGSLTFFSYCISNCFCLLFFSLSLSISSNTLITNQLTLHINYSIFIVHITFNIFTFKIFYGHKHKIIHFIFTRWLIVCNFWRIVIICTQNFMFVVIVFIVSLKCVFLFINWVMIFFLIRAFICKVSYLTIVETFKRKLPFLFS